MLGITWAKGTHQDLAPSGSPDMTYHGGKILPQTNVTAIFWGTTWAHYTGLNISGMDSWYQGFSGSNYAKTSDEYTGTNGRVGATLHYAGHYVDTSRAGDGNNPSTILAEVCKEITNPDHSGDGYYPVYVDLPRGSNGYCGYHSYGTCHGTRVQFAFFFKLDGDAGCNPSDSSGLHPEGLAALANVSGHELSEARTDPQLNAWYDPMGQENGDKCAWSYGVPLVTLSNGTEWKIQGEWSNSAYNGGSGSCNLSGQKGCLSGGTGSTGGSGAVTLNPNCHDFGNVPIDERERHKAVILTNNQSVRLSITNISITGDGHYRDEYSETNNCPSSLGPHASCTITVTFDAGELGRINGWLTVTDNAPTSPQTATFTAVGIPGRGR